MILNMNKVIVVKGINNTNIVSEPTNAPNTSLLNDIFLFNIMEVVSKSIRSKAKFINNNKSTYTFISFTF